MKIFSVTLYTLKLDATFKFLSNPLRNFLFTSRSPTSMPAD